MNKASPWSVPVAVSGIPDAGLHMELEAPEAVRSEIAAFANLRDLPRLTAIFDLSRRGTAIHVDGRVSARVSQICVVTLEPIESDIDEGVDLTFSPEPGVEEAIEIREDEEPPEPLLGGKVDLGAIATEFLILGIDPYPRKPGVTFTAPTDETAVPHPFAALEALKKRPGGGS